VQVGICLEEVVEIHDILLCHLGTLNVANCEALCDCGIIQLVSGCEDLAADERVNAVATTPELPFPTKV